MGYSNLALVKYSNSYRSWLFWGLDLVSNCQVQQMVIFIFTFFPTVLFGSSITPLNPSFTHPPNDIKNVFWLSPSLVWIIQWLCILHSSDSYREGGHASLLALPPENPYECETTPEWLRKCVIQMGFHECRKSWGPLPTGWHWGPFTLFIKTSDICPSLPL